MADQPNAAPATDTGSEDHGGMADQTFSPPAGETGMMDLDASTMDTKVEDNKDNIEDKGSELPEHRELQEKLTRTEAMVQTLQNLIATMQGGKPKDQEAAKPDFEDYSTFEDEKILEIFNENPKKFLANIARQIRHEVTEDMQSRGSQNQERDSMQKFISDNPDFRDLYQSGELRKVIEKDPTHNFRSAYMELTMEKRLKAAAEKAAKEAREATKRELSGSRILGPGPGRSTNPVSTPDLSTKAFGGDTTQALLARHRARQAAT